MQAPSVISLVTIQAPVQSHVRNALSSPPLRYFQSVTRANTSTSVIFKMSTAWMMQ